MGGDDLLDPKPGALQWRGQYHPLTGRPILIGQDGSPLTEYTITVTHPALNRGRPTNIPSIWNGQIQDEETAVAYALRSGGPWPSYKTIADAVEAAASRTDMLDQYLP